TVPFTPYLSGIEKTSSVGIFGLNSTPVLATADPPCQICLLGKPSSRFVPGPVKTNLSYCLFVNTSRALRNVSLCSFHASIGSPWSTLDIDRIDFHIFVTASSGDTFGKTFCHHLVVGIEMTVQGIVSFITSLFTLRIASERALFAIATRLGSMSANKSGSLE